MIVAVAVLQEDRGAVALEQHHGVFDQAGQDPVEVEPAADVAGHPSQRLGAMEEVGHLVGAPSAADDGAEPVGGDARDLEVARCRASRRSRRRPAGRPTVPRPPGMTTASSGRRSASTARASVLVRVGQEQARQWRPARPRAAGGQAEDAAEDPVSARQVHQPVRTGDDRQPAKARGVSRSPRSSQATTR